MWILSVKILVYMAVKVLETNFLIRQYCCREILALGNPEALSKVNKSLVYY